MWEDYAGYDEVFGEEDDNELDDEVRAWIRKQFEANRMHSMLRECEVSDVAYDVYLAAKGQTVAAVRRQIRNEEAELRLREANKVEGYKSYWEMVLAEAGEEEMTAGDGQILPENEVVKQEAQAALAVDCEMVMHYNVSRLASVGVVDWSGKDVYSAVVEVKDEVTSIPSMTGLTPDDLARGQEEEAVLGALQKLLNGRLVVFHAAAGDLAVMPGVIPRAIIDTYEETGQSLDRALRDRGIEVRLIHHDALEDARGTMRLLRRLLTEKKVTIDRTKYVSHCRVSLREPSYCPAMFGGPRQERLEERAAFRGLPDATRTSKKARKKEAERERGDQSRRALRRRHVAEVDRGRYARIFAPVRETGRRPRAHTVSDVPVVAGRGQIVLSKWPREIKPTRLAKMLRGTYLESDVQRSWYDRGHVWIQLSSSKEVPLWTTILHGWRGSQVVSPKVAAFCKWSHAYREILENAYYRDALVSAID